MTSNEKLKNTEDSPKTPTVTFKVVDVRQSLVDSAKVYAYDMTTKGPEVLLGVTNAKGVLETNLLVGGHNIKVWAFKDGYRESGAQWINPAAIHESMLQLNTI